ncbi:penicillin-binding protein 2B [Scopulibacillus daqui]|uniref:Penicillin-binding protein 2B n=1 Tax=Scopulibacillus daqui TaxID=1469162 RepID=A0ABS2PX34_9BACL|nr:penicillin-binding transpeptidase domain-containing protein [Scopulibacillus daqui]MBM7644260.1 penicillin-binding protein 2B [Scopulibacillus daqui]
MQHKNKSINKWAAIVASAFLLLFCIVIGRFTYLSIAKESAGHKLVDLGEKQWKHVKVVDAHRGNIYGRGGEVFAEDIPAYTLYAVLSHKAPSYVKDKEKTARELAPILDMSQDEILKILNNKKAFQVQFGSAGTKLSYAKKKQIEKLHLPGIGFITDSKRYYPNGEFASQVIGTTRENPDTGKQHGVLGIEKSLNKYLTEEDGVVSYYGARDGVMMPNSKEHMKKPHDGNDVYLTIDNRIQAIMESSMSKVEKEYKPKRMIAIAADPKTGQILGMADRPTFNPNGNSIKNYTNFAISPPYEPGSVMKIFTLAAAINEGVYNGDDKYESGTYKVGGVNIHDWNQSGWGKITFNDGLERSSNVGFSIIADKQLGTDKLHDYLKRFGFDKKTGIDLPNESGSIMDWNQKANQVETAFGQSSAFTAIQIVQAATAIANDGKMMKPYIIDKVENPNTNKTMIEHKPEIVGRPITKETAEKERELLRSVVTGKHGTGHPYNIKGYDVIGKTGTAQIAEKGKYLKGKNNYIFSFLGMAPKKDPKLIVYVAVDRPHLKPTENGDEPVADIFNPVMSNGLQYIDMAPNQKDSQKTDIQKAESQSVKLPDVVGQPMDEAKKTLKAKGLDVVAIGKGNVTKQTPFSGTKLLEAGKVILVGEGKQKMPDLTGWSMADALKLADVLSMKPDMIGNGYVTDQKPAPGSQVKEGDHLTLKLDSMTQTDKSDKQTKKPPSEN